MSFRCKKHGIFTTADSCQYCDIENMKDTITKQAETIERLKYVFGMLYGICPERYINVCDGKKEIDCIVKAINDGEI